MDPMPQLEPGQHTILPLHKTSKQLLNPPIPTQAGIYIQVKIDFVKLLLDLESVTCNMSLTRSTYKTAMKR